MRLRLTSLSLLILLTLAFAATPAAAGVSNPYIQTPTESHFIATAPLTLTIPMHGNSTLAML